MQWNDMYVSASAARLGRPEAVADAVADGRYDPEESRADGYLSVSVADADDPEGNPADMAVAAARTALRRAGEAGVAMDLHLHATSTFQGLDHWTPGSYIQHRTTGGHAPALEVRQACNGGLASLELAASYLTARPGRPSALLTTGDTYPAPAYQRYRCEKHMVLADGATALVLSRRPGVARLLSTVLLGDATHEGMSRGDAPWAPHSGAHGWPVSLRDRKARHLARGHDQRRVAESLVDLQHQAMEAALTDAGVKVRDIARFVFPNIGLAAQGWERRAGAGIRGERTTWEWGRRVGHVAAGDQFAGLTHLLETRAVRPGDLVALAGVGSGVQLGWAVLEIRSVPDWSDTAGGPHEPTRAGQRD